MRMKLRTKLTVAKGYSLIMSLVLIGLALVECNYSPGGVHYALIAFFKTSFSSPSWQKLHVPTIYKTELIYSGLLIVAGIVTLFMREPKVYRVFSIGIYTISAMFYAFVEGSLLNYYGIKALYSYAAVAVVLSFLGAIIGARVMVADDKIDNEKKEIDNIRGAEC